MRCPHNGRHFALCFWVASVSFLLCLPEGAAFFRQQSSSKGSLGEALLPPDKTLDAGHYPGVDIGAKINSAIADLGHDSGTVVVPAGVYSFSTTIVKPRGILLRGQGTGLVFSSNDLMKIGTILVWIPQSGTAIVVADPYGTNYESNTGIGDLTLLGPGISSNANGIWVGGDPSGVVSSKDDFADNESFEKISIHNFSRGVVWGSNAFLDRWLQCNIWGNDVGIFLSDAIVASNETNSFVQCYIGNNVGGAVRGLGNADLHFVSTSFDFNNTGAAKGGPSSVPAIESLNPGNFIDCHFEQWNGTFVDNSGTASVVRIIGGDATLDSSAPIVDHQMFSFGGVGSDVYISGVSIASAHRVAHMVSWNSPRDSALWIAGLLGNSNHQILAITNPLAAAPRLHIDANIFGIESPSISSVTSELKRLAENQGTQLSAKNVSLGQGWGGKASVVSILGYDPNFALTVKSGITATINPSLKISFADGSWSNFCVPSATRGDTNIPTTATWTVSTLSSKGMTLTFIGTPISRTAYTVYVICQGR